MTKKQRTQLKGLICILAILLLLILFIVKLVFEIVSGKEPKEPEKIPVVESLPNVWIQGGSEREITVFAEGTTRKFFMAESCEIGNWSAQGSGMAGAQEPGFSGQPGPGTTGSGVNEMQGVGTAGAGGTGKQGPGSGAAVPGEIAWELLRDKIADITLTDGLVTEVRLKDEKVHGAVERVGRDFVELEGYGRLELDPDYKGYRFYGEPAMKTAAELIIGYDFADFVVCDNRICAILFAGEDAMETIRVLLKTSNFEGLFHERLEISADTEFTVRWGNNGPGRDGAGTGESSGGAQYSGTQTGDVSGGAQGSGAQNVQGSGAVSYAPGEICVIDAGSFGGDGDTFLEISPATLTGKLYIKNLERSSGTPGYRGKLEIRYTAQGLTAVNVLPLEEYLYSVVPSEMPASYPMEALKAQAICARTYAYGKMQHAGYPLYGAHVDDSTSYQVYNNQVEQESTTNAVKATCGQILRTGSGLTAETFYYSTSCGRGTDAKVWKTEAAQQIDYLSGKRIRPDVEENPVPTGEESGFWWLSLLEGTEEGFPGVDLGILLEKDRGEGTGDGTHGESGRQDGNGKQDEGNGQDGSGQDLNITGAEFLLTRDASDFEVRQGWYRWIYAARELDVEEFRDRLKKYTDQDIRDFKEILSLQITARGAGGVADELTVETDKGNYTVSGENTIRKVLCDGETAAILWNGKSGSCPSLLPSAFFVMIPSVEGKNVVGYTLIGGGHGHGVGMSQNGAKEMALSGWTAEDILGFFYEKCPADAIY